MARDRVAKVDLLRCLRFAYDAGIVIVELRRYVMRPGRRDELIELFEREFVAGQERCGIQVVGHYRDLGDPDAFVWLRQFPDMESRRRSLEAFYVESQTWRDNRDAANATMIDSDNVLLLRPALPGSGFKNGALERSRAGVIAVSIFMLSEPANGSLADIAHAAGECAVFVTEEHPNTFPRLPVREGEWALVAVGACNVEKSALPPGLRERVISTEHLRLL